MKLRVTRKKTIVGRTEMVDFPELGILQIPAKIDTGAYSSAIHSHKIWTDVKEGITFLNFELLDPNYHHYVGLVFRTSEFSQTIVKSSNGKKEKRYTLKTTIILGHRKRKTTISLTNRKKMRFPVLIGRKLLKNGFVVDVSKSNLTK